MSERVYEVWRDYGSGPTVEDEYDNATRAIEDGRRAADNHPTETYEVVERTGEDTYEIVWSSR